MSEALCRTCLCWRRSGCSLMFYCQEERLYLYEIIMAFCHVEMKPDDNFPNDVCCNCLEDIKKAYSFKMKCEKSESVLRQNMNIRNYNQQNIEKEKLSDFSTLDNHELINIKSEQNSEIMPFQYEESYAIDVESDCKHQASDESNFKSIEKSSSIKNQTIKLSKIKKAKVKKKLKKLPVLNCLECDFTTKIPVKFKEHKNIHITEGNILNNVDKSLDDQKSMVTNEKNFDCPYCDYKCSNSSNLKRHVRIHTNDKPYSCDFCSYRCVQSSYMKDHQRLHTGEKPYLCDQCHYRCRSISSLKTHKNNKHSIERRFSCDICNFKAKTKSTLTVHKKMHAGMKNFSCDMCSYQSIQLSSLENHKLMVHSKERPFACDRCPYRCISASYLKIHQRTHLPVKAISCDVCAYSCHTKFQMKCHLMTHTGEKPHHCNICDFKCAQASSLRRHLKSHTSKTFLSLS